MEGSRVNTGLQINAGPQEPGEKNNLPRGCGFINAGHESFSDGMNSGCFIFVEKRACKKIHTLS